jgi:chromate transporter
MNLYGQIFYAFVKIGAFTIGGGYAMLPLIQKEVVEKKQWVSTGDFVDMIALAQSAPGILAVNIAILTGYRMKGTSGSIIAALGAIIPSFLILLLIAVFFKHFQDNIYIAKMFKTIRPAVVALIAVPVFSTAKTVGINIKTVIIPITAAGLIYSGISPVYIILISALSGIGWYLFSKRKK